VSAGGRGDGTGQRTSEALIADAHPRTSLESCDAARFQEGRYAGPGNRMLAAVDDSMDAPGRKRGRVRGNRREYEGGLLRVPHISWRAGAAPMLVCSGFGAHQQKPGGPGAPRRGGLCEKMSKGNCNVGD